MKAANEGICLAIMVQRRETNIFHSKAKRKFTVPANVGPSKAHKDLL